MRIDLFGHVEKFYQPLPKKTNRHGWRAGWGGPKNSFILGDF